MKLNKQALQELSALKRKNGKLMPVDVVKRARSKTSALHRHFVWDDTKAAHEHRLWQARELIVTVQVVFEGTEGREVQKYVSLVPDRQKGGGYRELSAVLTSAKLRGELLQTAFREMAYFRAKYKFLRELAEVFDAMLRIEQKLSRKKRKAA